MTERDDRAATAPAIPAGGQPLRLFYGRVVDEAELREALEIHGLDLEVAVLRIKLRNHIHEHPEDQALLLKSMESLVRAVSTRYRISEKRTNDLASALASVVDAVSGQFGGEI